MAAAALRLLAVAVPLALGACSVLQPEVDKAAGGFAGAVAADEPRAAMVGREILDRGGSAADAATAMYFALAVTRPSMASLGAEGGCVVYDRATNAVRALEFAAPAVSAPSGGGPVAAPPMAPRAMYALQATYGTLRWEQDVVPAEGLARFGISVSRTFARDIAASADVIRRDPGLSALLSTGTPGGPRRLLAEGDRLVQPNLAQWLTLVRERGPGALHEGTRAAELARAYAAAGTPLAETTLVSVAPRLTDPIVLPADDHRIAFLPGYASEGPYQALLWAALSTDRRYAQASDAERPHLLAEAAARAAGVAAGETAPRTGQTLGADAVAGLVQRMMAGYAPTGPGPEAAAAHPRDGSGTAIAALDRNGQGVACGFTMGAPFGTGRLAAPTGIVPALAGPPDRQVTALSPVVAFNTRTKTVFLLAAGAGEGAPTDIVAGASDMLQRQSGVASGLAAALAAPATGSIAAVYCAKGAPREVGSCVARTDPRGSGIGLIAGTPLEPEK